MYCADSVIYFFMEILDGYLANDFF
jgi:hypothetical protein